MKVILSLLILTAVLVTNGYYLYISYKNKERRLLTVQAVLLSIALIAMIGTVFGIFDFSIVSAIKSFTKIDYP